jgi:hypothetical protein
VRMSARRVRAIFRKELREYRRNRQIVVSMAVLPLLFTPLVAALSIWGCIAISTRSNDPRVATQLSMLACAPVIAVTTVISVGGAT